MDKIKLIVTDMDGTFLHHENTVSRGNRQAFWDAWDQGIHLAICSGRSPKDVRDIIKKEDLPPCYVLGYNGAHCVNPKGERLALHYMEPLAVARCGDIFEKEKVVYGIMNENRLALNRDPEEETVANRASMRFTKKAWTKITWDRETFELARSEGACKLIYIDRRPGGHLERIRAQIAGIKGLSIMSSWHDNIEIMPFGINKGTATKELADQLHIGAPHILALGDQENDLEMLAYAGYGVAMENAIDKVKAVAKYQTGHHQNDGVAQAIYRYALEERPLKKAQSYL